MSRAGTRGGARCAVSAAEAGPPPFHASRFRNSRRVLGPYVIKMGPGTHFRFRHVNVDLTRFSFSLQPCRPRASACRDAERGAARSDARTFALEVRAIRERHVA